ncbi:hypothetical protein O181_133942 [Austropuccinia psidii MF-1]|uniref:Uncharacterized protein n=1 Tax=Austropuccinia psidii MF-1 TaxID=1389203 RepID=A0A9Q3L955_9BASI|nr:hypothetical protein [Austropuccinia psidii MF-1]
MAIHGGNQKTIQGFQSPGPAGVGLVIHSGLLKGTILRDYTLFQSVVEESSITILLGQLNWSIQTAINQPICTWPNWANSYTTVGIQSHIQFSRWPDLY